MSPVVRNIEHLTIENQKEIVKVKAKKHKGPDIDFAGSVGGAQGKALHAQINWVKVGIEVFSVIGVLVAVYFIVTMYILPTMNRLYTVQEQLETVEVSASPVDDLGLNLESNSFSIFPFDTVTPANADLYFEINDFPKFYLTYANLTIEEKDYFEKFIPYVSENFVLFATLGRNFNGWTAVFHVNPGEAGEEIANIIEEKDETTEFWKIKLLDEWLVVSADVVSIEEVESAYKNTLLPLQKSPKYQSSNKMLAGRGQVKVIFLTSEGRQILADALKNEISNPLKEVLTIISTKSYNKAVIGRN